VQYGCSKMLADSQILDIEGIYSCKNSRHIQNLVSLQWQRHVVCRDIGKASAPDVAEC
jgi:hypothetical protein